MIRETRELLRLVGLREPEYTAKQLALIFKREAKTIVNVVAHYKFPHRIERYRRGGRRMLIPARTVRLLAQKFGFPVK